MQLLRIWNDMMYVCQVNCKQAKSKHSWLLLCRFNYCVAELLLAQAPLGFRLLKSISRRYESTVKIGSAVENIVKCYYAISFCPFILIKHSKCRQYLLILLGVSDATIIEMPSQVLLPNLVITAHICTGGDWCIHLATKNLSIKSSDILWQRLGLWKEDDFLPVYFSALHYWNDIFCDIIQYYRVMMDYFQGDQLVFVTTKVSLSDDTSVDKWRCGHSKTNFSFHIPTIISWSYYVIQM